MDTKQKEIENLINQLEYLTVSEKAGISLTYGLLPDDKKTELEQFLREQYSAYQTLKNQLQERLYLLAKK